MILFSQRQHIGDYAFRSFSMYVCSLLLLWDLYFFSHEKFSSSICDFVFMYKIIIHSSIIEHYIIH